MSIFVNLHKNLHGPERLPLIDLKIVVYYSCVSELNGWTSFYGALWVSWSIARSAKGSQDQSKEHLNQG